MCGTYAYGGSLHHRRPRGMGGNKSAITSSPANALLTCGHATSPNGCHAWIENNRAEALERGLLVRQSHDPAEVLVDLLIGRVVLTPDGDSIHEGAHA